MNSGTFWIVAIAVSHVILFGVICSLQSSQFGVLTALHGFFCRETYAQVLLERKTQALRKSTGNMSLVSKLDDGLSHKTRLKRALIRPLKMLILSPIVFLMALYVAVVYGILYLLYSTYTFVFEEYYHISPANVGLVYIGSGIGMIIGLFIIGGLSDRLLQKKAAEKGGELKPEYRLIPLIFMGWLVPIGLFIYGWTVQYHEQWAVPLFGALLFGIGIIGGLICIQV